MDLFSALNVYTVMCGRGLCLQVVQKLVEMIFCIQCILYTSVSEGLMFAGYAETCVVLAWASLMVEHKFFFPLFLICRC
jgi:hypothetical protein